MGVARAALAEPPHSKPANGRANSRNHPVPHENRSFSALLALSLTFSVSLPVSLTLSDCYHYPALRGTRRTFVPVPYGAIASSASRSANPPRVYRSNLPPESRSKTARCSRSSCIHVRIPIPLLSLLSLSKAGCLELVRLAKVVLFKSADFSNSESRANRVIAVEVRKKGEFFWQNYR